MQVVPSHDMAGIMTFAMFVIGAVTIFVHICFAMAVLVDAQSLPAGRASIFVGPVVWCLATLIGGVFVASAYWIMHHSRLNSTILIAPIDRS
jgi:hypothetical protein